MSLEKTWYKVEEAAGKFGLEPRLVLKWVEDGMVRCEMKGGKVGLVNIDDIQLKVQEMTGI